MPLIPQHPGRHAITVRYINRDLAYALLHQVADASKQANAVFHRH